MSLIKGKDTLIGEKKRVMTVSTSKMKLQIDGVKLNKTDGTEVLRWVSPANIKIVQLGKVDQFRQKIIDRRKEAREKIVNS